MSSALKSLQALHDKVDREYSNIKTALGKYWATERQQFHSVMVEQESPQGCITIVVHGMHIPVTALGPDYTAGIT